MSPGLMVIAAFVGCLVGFTALMLGLAALLQGYFYSQAADKLVVRSLIAGLLLAMVSTGWAYVNTRASHKDKYGTFFEFNPTSVTDISAFDAVRMLNVKGEDGQFRTETVPFVFQGKQFIEKESGKPFARSSSSYVTTALIVTRDNQPRKFLAPPLEGMRYTGLTQASDALIFTEENGTSFLSDQDLRRLESPSKGAYVLALLLNALLFLIWIVACWPVMGYSLGHSLMFATILGGVHLFVLMPLLFQTIRQV